VMRPMHRLPGSYNLTAPSFSEAKSKKYQEEDPAKKTGARELL
jgi:hypothetical protein